MPKWWVNAPGAKSVSYSSESAAKRVASQVKGAKVSKGQPVEHGIMRALARMVKGGTGESAKLPRDKRR